MWDVGKKLYMFVPDINTPNYNSIPTFECALLDRIFPYLLNVLLGSMKDALYI